MNWKTTKFGNTPDHGADVLVKRVVAETDDKFVVEIEVIEHCEELPVDAIGYIYLRDLIDQHEILESDPAAELG